MLAMAQNAAPARIDEACKAELTGLCAASVDKRGGGVRCLGENQAKLGAACATAVKTVQERREKFQAACKADSDKLCAAEALAKGGRGEVVGCLRAKQAELSKPCAELVAALPQGKR